MSALTPSLSSARTPLAFDGSVSRGAMTWSGTAKAYTIAFHRSVQRAGTDAQWLDVLILRGSGQGRTISSSIFESTIQS
jgi:hypothetical protein